MPWVTFARRFYGQSPQIKSNQYFSHLYLTAFKAIPKMNGSSFMSKLWNALLKQIEDFKGDKYEERNLGLWDWILTFVKLKHSLVKNIL